jgi:hypothetical protein
VAGQSLRARSSAEVAFAEFVHGRTGTLRDESFLSTESAVDAETMIETYTDGRKIENPISKGAFLFSLGGHARLEPVSRRAGTASQRVPLRAGHGRGVPGQPVVPARRDSTGYGWGTGRASTMSPSRTQSRRSVAGCGRNRALVIPGQRDLLQTPNPIPPDPAQRPGPGRLRRARGPLAEAAEPIDRPGSTRPSASLRAVPSDDWNWQKSM